jgi:hypothetical protein
MTRKKVEKTNPEATTEGEGDGYEVGYGRPPKHTRFSKGRSGNPKGRPAGARNFSTDVTEVLKSPVKTRDGARLKTMSTQMAALLRLREQALKGDFKAMNRLLELAAQYGDKSIAAHLSELSLQDKAIMDGFASRQCTGSNSGSAVSASQDGNDGEGEDA